MNGDKSILTEKNNASVYNETTVPLQTSERNGKETRTGTEKESNAKKPKRRDKSDLGPDFVAPDGGWGWLIVLAQGVSNLAVFPPFQQYGLIYRSRLKTLGFNAKQTTTIVNVIMALSSLIGIVNGAMYRRFSFRQVAIAGSLMAFCGIFLTAFCTTFVQYILCYSCLYGVGIGLNMTATALAVNVYFKNKRRRATGYSWTITGMGPIIFPHLTTFLLAYYGTEGTILIYSAILLNAFLCALTLQPVQWHVKKQEKVDNADQTKADLIAENGNTIVAIDQNNAPEYECKFCEAQRRRKRSIFSSQYLLNDDDPDKPSYDITEPGTPMLARANDGWFGSKLSLTSLGQTPRFRPHLLHQLSHKEDLHVDSTSQGETSPLYKSNYFSRERTDKEHYASKTSVYSKSVLSEEQHCTCAEEKALLQQMTEKDKLAVYEKLKAEEEAEELEKSKMSFGQKVIKFFDLDLLKDATFLNLVMGMIVMMFGEINFSVLTPFILHDYGYTNQQISLAMSLLGCMDVAVRFIAPLLLENVKWDNRVLFAFGILAISLGRALVTMTSSYNTILGLFVLIGFGKGFRTIFGPLIIPSYVPLKRLPAATGLHLIIGGIFSISCGPFLGYITDTYNYTVTIHVINFMTAVMLLIWLSESALRRILGKPRVPMAEN